MIKNGRAVGERVGGRSEVERSSGQSPMNGNESKTGTDCLFCRWIREGRAVETYGSAAGFKDGYPVTDGHLLVVPLRHAKNWFAMTERELRDIDSLIRILAEKIRRDDPSVSGFNIGTNIGESAGQTVFHAHIHLIPRRTGDSDNPRGGIRGVIDGKRCY
ncbi:MAG: HIT family protein [Desulfobacterales bacterium]|nr:HIT family protein [Desulfobacterales bacterium]